MSDGVRLDQMDEWQALRRHRRELGEPPLRDLFAADPGRGRRYALEVGDLYVVNKADRDGAAKVRRELRSMLALSARPEGAWRPPVLSVSAQSHAGLDELAETIEKHRAWLEESGALASRRARRAREEIEAIAVAALRSRWELQGRERLEELATAVAGGGLDPYAAADELIG